MKHGKRGSSFIGLICSAGFVAIGVINLVQVLSSQEITAIIFMVVWTLAAISSFVVTLKGFIAEKRRPDNVTEDPYFSGDRGVDLSNNVYCPYCGNTVERDHVYCRTCGRQLM